MKNGLFNGMMNKAMRTNLKKVWAIAILLLFTGFFHLPATAQQRYLPLKSPLAVDPRDLNANPTISLGSYGGRDGDQTVIEINYSSGGLWHGDVSPDDAGLPFQHFAVSPIFNRGSGWSSSLDLPEIDMGGAYVLYNESGDAIDNCPDQETSVYFHVNRISISIPGDGTHELRKDDQLHQTVCTNHPPFDLSGTFYSVDGSKLRYDNDLKILYLPNGGRYYFEQVATTTGLDGGIYGTKYIDANGNKRIYSVTGGYWTDTLGRQFIRPLLKDRTVGEQALTVPGLGNSTLTYTLKWEKLEQALAPGQQLHYRGDVDCGHRSNTGQPTGSYLPALFTTVTPNFVCANSSEDNSSTPVKFNPVVLSEARLPNGQKYQYKYTPYGELERVVYPMGGYQRFRYVTDVCSQNGCQQVSQSTDPNVTRYVGERFISANGLGTDELRWQYPSFCQTIRPDGIQEVANLDSMYYTSTKFGFVDIRDWVASVTQSFTVVNGQMKRRTVVNRPATVTNFPAGTYNVAYTTTRDPRISGEINIVFEATNNDYALATLTTTDYDSNSDPTYFANLNPKSVKHYDYVAVPKGIAQTGSYDTLAAYFNGQQPLRIEETDYQYSATYKARNIVTLPVESRVLNGNGVTVAKSQVSYDDATYLDPVATTTTVPGWENPLTSVRGLPTITKNWKDVANNQYVETRVAYDQFGNVTKSYDAMGSVTTTEYDAAYQAYPIKITTPIPDTTGHGSNVPFVTTATFDPKTGLPLSTTDANGQTTSMEYNDSLLRQTKATAPNGRQTITEYDNIQSSWVKIKTQIDNTKWKESVAYVDGLGRTIKREIFDSGGNIITETEYDNGGRVRRVTNPYRQGEQKFWNRNDYDEAGRVKESFAPAPDGQTGNSLGTVQYSISTASTGIGTVITQTDATGKKSRSITNALGQLIRIDEATANNNLGDIATPTQPTFYAYSTLGKMVKVQQGNQYRYFLYDSLNRLLRIRQPEQEINAALNTTGNIDNNSWTAGFTYNDNGNVLTATDAKNITITNAYDNNNRIKTRTYSDSTPQVNYFYDDPNVPFSNERLTKVVNSVSTSQTTAFDSMGRSLNFQQITDGQTYTSQYQYNLSGGLIQETYPSGRIIKNEADAGGNLSRISGELNNRVTTYANSFSYSASGAIEKLKLGNGRWETAQFNNRLQVTQIGLGYSANDFSLLKINYDYGEIDGNGNLVAANNNGDIARQTISFAGLAQPFVQTYKYDSINRLTEAKETSGGQRTWQQNWNYDRFGNRTSYVKFTGDTQAVFDNKTNPTIDLNTNRFNTGQGYQYDANGNLVQDADNRQFTFNGDNKQTLVKDANNNVVGSYYYDGDGKRIKKVTASETTIFVYSGGKLIQEYSTQTSPNPIIAYLTQDALGSPRIITNQLGEVVSRRDFMPFGEEIFADPNYRKTNFKYGYGDAVRQNFTGYQKDEETQLDFAEARYYNSTHGRFTAVDPLLASGKSADPQTFNRYTYVMNNPISATDPSGMLPVYFRTLANGDIQWSTKDHSNGKGGWQVYKGGEHTITAANGRSYRITRDGIFAAGNRSSNQSSRQQSPVSDAPSASRRTGADYAQAEEELEFELPEEVLDELEREAAFGEVPPPPTEEEVRLQEESLRALEEWLAMMGLPCEQPLSPASQQDAEPEVYGPPSPSEVNTAPNYVANVLGQIESSGGNAPSGYVGGRPFGNDGRRGQEILPQRDSSGSPITYREYDVYPHQRGVNRGAERIVRGSDGRAYYTINHYDSFMRIR